MNLLGNKIKLWLGISLASVILSAIALGIWGLKPGLDFTGGTLLEVSHPSAAINQEQLITELEEAGISHPIVQQTGERSLLIKAEAINQETHDRVVQVLQRQGLTEERFENVGPTVGRDLTQKAIQAVIVASIAIILYVAYSFRNVPKPANSWRFGVTAVLALIHDIFITIGVFAILGHFFGYEVDALFITALLTIMGFSVHDTIVVFDRLRETMTHSPISTPDEFEEMANQSLIQTLNRSLNTSLTVILVLLAMVVLGGESIRPFIIALLIGITVGTYSSIATATPLLAVWQRVAMQRTARKRS